MNTDLMRTRVRTIEFAWVEYIINVAPRGGVAPSSTGWGTFARLVLLVRCTRILGRRTAPYPTFPYSYPRPAWFYPNILVLTHVAAVVDGVIAHLRQGAPAAAIRRTPPTKSQRDAHTATAPPSPPPSPSFDGHQIMASVKRYPI